MLILQLFNHYWKSIFRNAVWRRNLMGKIVYGLLLIYLLAVFMMLGIRIEKFLQKMGGDPVEVFNSFLLWYFLFDMVIRTMFQPSPTLQVIPYTRFSIKKSKIINYLLLRNLWNVFNILPWLVIVPFSVKMLVPSYSLLSVICYYMGILLVLLFNNYATALLKYLSQKQFLYAFIPIILVLAVKGFNNYVTPVGKYSTLFGNQLLTSNILLLIVLSGLVFAIFKINHSSLRKGFYLDELKLKKDNKITSGLLNMQLFERFGLVGKYMDFELNLTFRNKRSRQGLVMMPFFVVYFFYLFSRDDKLFSSGGMTVYFLSIYSGFAALIHGQYLFSWESTYMDGIMARNLDFVKYLKGKYYFMSLLVILVFAPSFTGFFFVSNGKPYIYLAITLFVLGIMMFVMFIMATKNDSRIQLSQSQYFNYQGVKGQHFLISFAFFLIPLLLYLGIKAISNEKVAYVSIGSLGILGIIFHDFWLRKIVAPRFLKRKYKNLEGYRKLTN